MGNQSLDQRRGSAIEHNLVTVCENAKRGANGARKTSSRGSTTSGTTRRRFLWRGATVGAAAFLGRLVGFTPSASAQLTSCTNWTGGSCLYCLGECDATQSCCYACPACDAPGGKPVLLLYLLGGSLHVHTGDFFGS